MEKRLLLTWLTAVFFASSFVYDVPFHASAASSGDFSKTIDISDSKEVEEGVAAPIPYNKTITIGSDAQLTGASFNGVSISFKQNGNNVTFSIPYQIKGSTTKMEQATGTYANVITSGLWWWRYSDGVSWQINHCTPTGSPSATYNLNNIGAFPPPQNHIYACGPMPPVNKSDFGFKPDVEITSSTVTVGQTGYLSGNVLVLPMNGVSVDDSNVQYRAPDVSYFGQKLEGQALGALLNPPISFTVTATGTHNVKYNQYAVNGTITYTYDLSKTPYVTAACTASPNTVTNYTSGPVNVTVTLAPKYNNPMSGETISSWLFSESYDKNGSPTGRQEQNRNTASPTPGDVTFTVTIPAPDINLGSATSQTISFKTAAVTRLTNGGTRSKAAFCSMTVTKQAATPPPSGGGGANTPPWVTVRAPLMVQAGDDVSLDISAGDPDNDPLTFSTSSSDSGGTHGTINGPGKSTVWFSNIGSVAVSATVFDGKGGQDTDKADIQVTPPYPRAQLDVIGQQKVNRRIVVDGSKSVGNARFPVDWTRTEWTVTPVSGMTAADIKTKSAMKGTQQLALLFKQSGTVEVTIRVYNSLGYSSSTTRTLNIGPDLAPVADFSIPKTIYRDPDNASKASVTLFDTSSSPDGDNIARRIWLLSVDADNNGAYDNEPWFVYDNDTWRRLPYTYAELKTGSLNINTVNDGNRQSVTYVTPDVGKIKVELIVEDEVDAIPEFITPADILQNHTFIRKPTAQKVTEVINAAPTVTMKVQDQENKKLDIIAFTDYTGVKLNDLITNLNQIKSELFNTGIDMNFSLLQNKKKYGIQQRTTTVLSYARLIHFSFDEVLQNCSNCTPEMLNDLHKKIHRSWGIGYENAQIDPELGERLPPFQASGNAGYYSQYTDYQGMGWAYIGTRHVWYDQMNPSFKAESTLIEQFSYTTYYYKTYSNHTWSGPDNYWSYTGSSWQRQDPYDVYGFDMQPLLNYTFRPGSEKMLMLFSDNAATEFWNGAGKQSYSFMGFNKQVMNFVNQNGMAVYAVVPLSMLDVKFDAGTSYNSDVRLQENSIRQLLNGSPDRGKWLGTDWKAALDYLKLKNVLKVNSVNVDNNTITIKLDEQLTLEDAAKLSYFQEIPAVRDLVGNLTDNLDEISLTNITNVPTPGAPPLQSGLLLTDAVNEANNGKTVISFGRPSAAGNRFRYKLSSDTAPVPTPQTGDNVTSWTFVTNGTLIPAANGQHIGVAEVDASNRVVQFLDAPAVVIDE